MQEMQVQSLDWENPLEKEMETHSSILAWEIPRTEEPGGLQSMGVFESDMTEGEHKRKRKPKTGQQGQGWKQETWGTLR